MKNAIIKQILQEVETIAGYGVMLGIWMVMDGEAGYMIRRDGAVFGFGDFNDLGGVGFDQYGTLDDIPEKELTRILGNLMEADEMLSDMASHPGSFHYKDVPGVVAWAKELVL